MENYTSVIEEMLEENLSTELEKVNTSPEALKKQAQVNELYQIFYSRLNKEDSELFDRYWEACGLLMWEEEKRAYSLGARFGLRFAVETFFRDGKFPVSPSKKEN